MIVLGLSGSVRRGSYNRRLLEAAGAELPPGAALRVFGGLGDIPPYSEDLTAPGAVRELREAIATADAVLIATPEYNSSVPGQLKNALDWASRPFPDNCLRGKPVAVMGASTGLFGAVWAQAELRKVLRTIGARVIEAELPIGQAHEAFDDEGGLRDAGLRVALADLVGQLLRRPGALAGQGV
ncbi:MAG TPA: NAD(P)H-dependent oxidoreductase [Pseudonocardiaceae bacterium]|nr:NAD(P)H-dependent oxidoreductase [Pseudonocardiaceae bacterium]